MLFIIKQINLLINNISEIYQGEYKESKEISSIRNEILNGFEIPNYQDDKKNLKSDLIIFYHDVKKAYDQHKLSNSVN